MDPLEYIRQAIEAEVPSLSPPLLSWTEQHLVTPRTVTLSADPDGKTMVIVWLVTDHVGVDDSSYRVVFDPSSHAFGLECTLDSGVQWYMGPVQGGLAHVIRTM